MARGIDPPKGGVSSVANKAGEDAAKKNCCKKRNKQVC